MTLTDTKDAVRVRARRLRDLVEPLAANVYFAPEAHAGYATLGFGPSPAEVNGVAMPDGPAYFTSRGACLGRVPGEVVAAAFAVFNPEVVVPAVTHGWSLTEPDAILDARCRGATAALRRILGPQPDGVRRATELLRRGAEAVGVEGHHLFAGLRSLGFPGDPLGDLWRAADLVREHRGDSHIAVWAGAGLDPVEIGLLTELYWGLAPRSYVRTRAWGVEDLDAATDRLTSAGWISEGRLTDGGRRFREEIEIHTDDAEGRLVRAIGDDVDELLDLLAPWARAVVAAKGYPDGPGSLSRRP
ncbi:MAG TPA: hypothetical protein VE990_02550 [Acidimicrobiales bacterium]|nr:hypothetical protein [Acidimicrobiales bacterium]